MKNTKLLLIALLVATQGALLISASLLLTQGAADAATAPAAPSPDCTSEECGKRRVIGECRDNCENKAGMFFVFGNMTLPEK